MDVIVDLQSLIDDNKEFIVKELSVLTVCDTLLQHWMLKPPYAIEELSTYARKKADYIVNNLHGITWDSADVDYSLLESLISRATTRAGTGLGEALIWFASQSVFFSQATGMDVLLRACVSHSTGRGLDQTWSEKKKVLVKYTSSTIVDLYDRGQSRRQVSYRQRERQEQLYSLYPARKMQRNCAVFNRTAWQELGSYKSGSDLIDVAVDQRDIWSTPVPCYCKNLIDTLVVDVCDTLTELVDVIDLEQPTVETHIKNLDLISATYYTRQVVAVKMTPGKIPVARGNDLNIYSCLNSSCRANILVPGKTH
uniref:Uncharacterized protein n=1 Tax=Timema douglasi TaxID=61478 RepID=A0A7R8VJ63_TIMDO|nr:unnamed protein product [Timema douglasi]